MECTPIGYVETPFDSREETPRQGFLDDASGTVRVDPAYREGLRGVEAGSDLLVVWAADRADRSSLVSERRGRGVFATRSPNRPNPLGLTRCAVTAVAPAEGTVAVSGVDMLDGSPVLDLKPPLDYS